MTKIYVIDDEQLIREGIKKMIRENCPDSVVIGEASNGKTAYDETVMLKPDIAIVDICMPVMGGLEYVKLVRKKLAKAKFIMISGYADFKYAKESLALGCSYYLLKPLKHDELIAAINKLSDDIKNDIDKAEAERETHKKIKELDDLKRTNFIWKVLNREVKNIDQTKLDMLELGYLKYGFYLAVLNVDRYTAGNVELNSDYNSGGSLIAHVSEIISVVLNRNPEVKGLVIETGEREVVIIIGFKNKKHSLDEAIIIDLLKQMQAIIKKYYQVSTTIGYIDYWVDLAGAAEAFAMARSAVKYRFIGGPGKIFKYRKMMNNEIFAYPYEEETRLILGIEQKNPDEVLGGLTSIMGSFEHGEVNQNICFELVNSLYLKVKQRIVAINAQEILGLIPDYAHFKNRLDEIDTLNDLKLYLMEIFKKIVGGFQSLTPDSKRKVVKVALEFLDKNYDANIGLNEVADFVGMSPSYFSILFKKQVGDTFTDYFIKFRIEKAKMYLTNSHIKVHEVAKMVGYSDPKHFGKIFKRVVGVTPAEYREKNGYV